MQDQRSKLTHVGWAITTLIKVRIPSLVSTMSTCQWKELNVVEGNACSHFYPTWKLTSCVMATRVSWTTSWVPMCLLPWVQYKRWIPIRSMGCVRTHRRRSTIEGCGSLSHVWSVVEKIGEDKWKVGKIGQIIRQKFALRLEHDKIWA
jgi:hypothetical protein